MNASELHKNQSAVITSVKEGFYTQKLMEMGCVPGTSISLEYTAPSGDPIALNIDGYVLGLRKEEAEYLHIELSAQFG